LEPSGTLNICIAARVLRLRQATRACLLLALALVFPTAFAAPYYTSESAPFNWVDTTGHTRVTVWRTSCGTTGNATGDDSVNKTAIALGFSFNFGGTAYTTVYLSTNGRLQFSNANCGIAPNTKINGPPRTYALPFPNATLVRTLKVYGADLDLSTAGGGTLTYKTLGTAPNRSFVATWNNVKAWKASTGFGNGTSYNLQIQLYENGEFYYMYGVNDDISEPSNTAMGPAEIGWEISTTSYVVTQTGLPANNTGIRYYKKSALIGLSEYRFEESSYAGTAQEVKDASATPYNGQRINTPTSANKTQVTPLGKICRAVSIVQNTTAAQVDSIRSGVSPATIGNAGTISLWYKSNSAWVGTNNALFDATNSTNRWFYLAKLADGTLRFKVPDNTGATVVLTATSSVQSIPAGTWTHIAVTWDLSIPSASTVRIFVNGTLVGSYTGASNGSIRTSLTSVIDLGDLRVGTYNDLGSTPYSADGLLDEVHFYSRALNATEIATDRDITRSCGAPDHFTLTHDGTGINCQAEQVKITAHLADHTAANGYVGTINLTASTNHGDWSISDAFGSLNNGTANDGKATFTFVSPDQGEVILSFKNTYAETVTIGVADGVITESSGVTTSAEHLPLTFAGAGFQFQADSVGNAIGPQIAGKYSNVEPGDQTLTLQAIKTNDQTDACEAALVGSQTISLAAECVSPTTCRGAVFSVTGDSEVSLATNASGAVSAYSNVPVTFDETGAAPFSLRYLDAGTIRLYAKYAIPLLSGSASTNTMLGTSNAFTWRPFGFDVQITGNPAATSSSGTQFTSAGTLFNGTARAVIWTAADDADADGIPDGMTSSDANPNDNASLSDNLTTQNFAPTTALSLSSTLYSPVGGTHPGLAGSPSALFSSGTASISGLRYDETGIIEVAAVQSGDYLSLGIDETSKIRGHSGPVGRFYPKRFELSANTPTVADSCVAGAFTYQGQPFYFNTAPVLTLTALNAQGTTTANYTTSGYFKLPTSLSARSYSNAAAGTHPLSTALGSNAILAGDTGGTGVATLTLPAGSTGDSFTYTRTAAEGPFAANISASFPAAALTDSDGVCYDSNSDGVCDAFPITGITGANLRYGRLVTDNAFGPETMPLTPAVYAQYFNGSGYVTNSADSCTVITAAAFDFGSGSYTATPAQGVMSFPIGSGTSTASLGSTTLSAGALGLTLSAPGAGKTGEIDYSINLTTAGASWLQDDWNGDGTRTDNPRARASFGIYKGTGKVIFRRDQW